MLNENLNEKPTITTLVVFHSYGEKDFEVLNIAFPELVYTEDMPMEQIVHQDSLAEMASEDVGEFGDISKAINKILWNQNNMERLYCVKINLFYRTVVDYLGEVDTEVKYTYELADFEKEWEHLDLIQKGNKIYYLDYEESNSSYTVIGLSNVFDNPVLKSGLYYNVHSDKLPEGTGYYPIYSEDIDSEEISNRFFSSPEKAKKAYCKFKEFVAKKNL